MRKLGACALIAAALVFAGASASVAQSKVAFGVGGGLLMPMGDYGDVDNMGFTFGGGASIGLGSAPVRLRVEGSYGTSSHDGVGGKTKILGGMVSVVYPFQTAGQIKPYVLAGLGYYNVDVSVTGFGSADESKLGFGGGAGVMFPMSSVELFVEARFMSIATDERTTFLPIIAGVRFGGK